MILLFTPIGATILSTFSVLRSVTSPCNLSRNVLLDLPIRTLIIPLSVAVLRVAGSRVAQSNTPLRATAMLRFLTLRDKLHEKLPSVTAPLPSLEKIA